MPATPLSITDLTLRDAHQSLFATRMLTADMLPVAGKLDAVGFWSLETWGGATFDTCIRFLNEDPWDRLRRLRAALPRTPMQMLLRGQNLLGYRHYADDVVEAFVDLAARNGVQVFRVFDALNDTRNLATALRAVKRSGKHAQAAISFAVTPVHTVARYVDLAGRLAAMGADSLCIKDMAGLLKPYGARELTRAIKKAVDLPLQIHSHATTGMSVATLVEAVGAGADGIDTTISSMAMGTSHSPTETMAEIFRGTEHDTGLDLALLTEIAAYFRDVRRKYRAFESAFVGADARILVSQIPGGMLSNLESQLREQGAGDSMDKVMEEIAVVQKDFGYPPLETPTSQIVGTQGVMNVLFGRYERLTQESCNLLVGLYGETPAEPNADLVRKALRELKMERSVDTRPADAIPPEMDKLRTELQSKLGASAVDPADVLTYAMFPQVALAFFKTRPQGPVELPPPDKPAAGPSPQPAPGAALRHEVTVDGASYEVASVVGADGAVTVEIEGQTYRVRIGAKRADAGAPAPAPTAPQGSGAVVRAPMPGTIVRLLKSDGDTVARNEPVLVLEALKMQMEIRCTEAGRVRYLVQSGDSVRAQAALAEVTP